MKNDDLDVLLAAVKAPLPSAVKQETRNLADKVNASQIVRKRWSPQRWMIPVVIGSTLALTGGAGAAVYTVTHWAQVSMPQGNVRSAVPIPVQWRTEDGHVKDCRAWIELRNPRSGDQQRLDHSIAGYDWDGLGQGIYDTNVSTVRADLGESVVIEHFEPHLRKFFAGAFPGAGWLEARGDSTAVDAWGAVCEVHAP